MVQFLSIIFFLGFLQFLLGFSKVPVNFVCKTLRDSDQVLFKPPVLLCSASLAATADIDICLYRVDLCLLSSFGLGNLTYTISTRQAVH